MSDILAKNYRARVRKTDKMQYRYPMPSIRLAEYDRIPIDDDITALRERIFDVEIAESDLTRLENDLNTFDEVLKIGPYRYHENIENEHYLRRTNKAVKKAYDHYRMILRLAAEGKVNNTD